MGEEMPVPIKPPETLVAVPPMVVQLPLVLTVRGVLVPRYSSGMEIQLVD